MKKRVSIAGLLLLFAGLLCSAVLTTGKFRDLPQKEAFRERIYPQYFVFRGELVKNIHNSYETWSAAFGDCSGLMRKFVNDELIIYPNSPVWANRYSEEHPEKLVLMHLNGEARQVVDFPEVLQRYFPGHWVHLPGSMAADGVKALDNTIRVANARAFTMRGYVIDRTTRPATFAPQNVILVRVDKQGNRLWYESEYATLTAVDYKTNTISLKRGEFHTSPRDFAGGELYIAPIAGGKWGKDVMWFYNLSSACPKDKSGKQAWEVFADEIAGWFSAGGVVQNVQGIAFDVNYFDIADRYSTWDTDNDGVADGGVSADGGRNLWREGDWKFLSRLRGEMGPDFILSSDSENDNNQQAVGVMDGMESEGLVQHDDMWRGFSRAVNTHLYWKANNTSKYDYRYVVLKLNGADEKRPGQLRRFGAASACCLEAFVTDVQPRDFMPAAFSAPGSLGRAQGELVRYAKTTKPVFRLDAGTGAGAARMKEMIDAPLCQVALADGGGGVVIRGKQAGQRMTFSIKNVELPAGDVTIFVKARAIDPLDGFNTGDRVPRIMWLRPATLPDYGEGDRLNEYYTRIYGMIGTRRTEELSYYFRRMAAGTGAGTQTLDVEVQGTGAIELSSLEVYGAPDVIARRFDKAIVAVNPSLEPVRVDIAALFGSEYKKVGAVDIPAVDAAFIPTD